MSESRQWGTGYPSHMDPEDAAHAIWQQEYAPFFTNSTPEGADSGFLHMHENQMSWPPCSPALANQHSESLPRFTENENVSSATLSSAPEIYGCPPCKVTLERNVDGLVDKYGKVKVACDVGNPQKRQVGNSRRSETVPYPVENDAGFVRRHIVCQLTRRSESIWCPIENDAGVERRNIVSQLTRRSERVPYPIENDAGFDRPHNDIVCQLTRRSQSIRCPIENDAGFERRNIVSQLTRRSERVPYPIENDAGFDHPEIVCQLTRRPESVLNPIENDEVEHRHIICELTKPKTECQTKFANGEQGDEASRVEGSENSGMKSAVVSLHHIYDVLPKIQENAVSFRCDDTKNVEWCPQCPKSPHKKLHLKGQSIIEVIEISSSEEEDGIISKADSGSGHGDFPLQSSGNDCNVQVEAISRNVAAQDVDDDSDEDYHSGGGGSCLSITARDVEDKSNQDSQSGGISCRVREVVPYVQNKGNICSDLKPAVVALHRVNEILPGLNRTTNVRSYVSRVTDWCDNCPADLSQSAKRLPSSVGGPRRKRRCLTKPDYTEAMEVNSAGESAENASDEIYPHKLDIKRPSKPHKSPSGAVQNTRPTLQLRRVKKSYCKPRAHDDQKREVIRTRKRRRTGRVDYTENMDISSSDAELGDEEYFPNSGSHNVHATEMSDLDYSGEDTPPEIPDRLSEKRKKRRRTSHAEIGSLEKHSDTDPGRNDNVTGGNRWWMRYTKPAREIPALRLLCQSTAVKLGHHEESTQKCGFCDTLQSSLDDIKDHYAIHHNITLSKLVNASSFRVENPQKEKNGLYKCPNCGLCIGRTKPSCNRHIEKTCKQSLGKLVWACSICNAIQSRMFNFERHFRLLHSTKNGKLANQETVTLSTKRKKLRKSSGSHRRRRYEVTAGSPWWMHYSKPIRQIPTLRLLCQSTAVKLGYQVDSSQKCSFCNIHVSNLDDIKSHYAIQHNVTLSKLVNASSFRVNNLQKGKNGHYKCPNCSLFIDRFKKSCVRHIENSCTHSLAKLHVACLVCNSIYPRMTSLQQHVETFHAHKTRNLAQEVKCSTCGILTSPVQLTTHMKVVHNISVHWCSGCDFWSSKKSDVDKHNLAGFKLDENQQSLNQFVLQLRQPPKLKLLCQSVASRLGLDIPGKHMCCFCEASADNLGALHDHYVCSHNFDITLLGFHSNTDMSISQQDGNIVICPLCQTGVESNTLKVHIKNLCVQTVDRLSYRCAFCSVTVSDMVHCRRHVLKAHAEEAKIVECNYCRGRFLQEGLAHHMVVIHRKSIFRYNPFWSNGLFFKHSSRKSLKHFQDTNLFSTLYPQRAKYFSVQREDPPQLLLLCQSAVARQGLDASQQMKCCFCGWQQPGIAALQKHCQLIHSINIAKMATGSAKDLPSFAKRISKSEYSCRLCGDNFKSNKSLLAVIGHLVAECRMLYGKIKFKCKLCHKVTPKTDVHLRYGHFIGNRKRACKECGKSMLLRKLGDHLELLHGVKIDRCCNCPFWSQTKSIIENNLCRNCQKPWRSQFSDRQGLVPVCPPEFTDISEICLDSVQADRFGKFRCPFCLAAIVSHPALRNHIKLACKGYGELKYKISCRYCGVRLRRSDYKNHIEGSHFDTVPSNFSVCNFCNIAVGDAEMAAHLEDGHHKVLYRCRECSSWFLSSIEFHVHEREKHPQPFETEVYCIKCSEKFEDKNDAVLHQKKCELVRGLQNKLKYRCKICGAFSKSLYGYEIHMRKHTGEKPYVCHVCGRNFTQPGSFDRHMKSHSGQKDFKCNICGKAFVQKCTLDRHLLAHEGIKKYMCPICGAKFSQSYPLSKHMKSKHPELVQLKK